VAETRAHVRRIVTSDPEQTRALGARLGAATEVGDVFLLEGPFGSGKTVLVQGLAAGLGVETYVSSPSFVLVNQHVGRLTLYHVDLYRIERLDPEMEDTVADAIESGGVTCIEWPQLLPPDLRRGATLVHFERGEGDQRAIELATDQQRLADALAEPLVAE
jgi:tRNA threonylcarbamoyladenosine biosynthesis protein TsaE